LVVVANSKTKNCKDIIYVLALSYLQHARTALPKDSDGGEALFENVVFWDNKD
jgi:hypothetical protein